MSISNKFLGYSNRDTSDYAQVITILVRTPDELKASQDSFVQNTRTLSILIIQFGKPFMEK